MSEQRTATFRAYFENPRKVLRPLIVSLNGDNSWLISIPRPRNEREDYGKAYFHIVYEPWLVGPVVTWATWFVRIGLPWLPKIEDGDAVEGLIDEIENAAAAAGFVPRPSEQSKPLADVIFLSMNLGDHTHEATLKTFDSNIPVFGTKDAAGLVQSWNHFDRVSTFSDLEPGNGNWLDLHPGAPLPKWLNFFQLPGHSQLDWASSIIWTTETGKHESLLMAPHVIKADHPSLQTFAHDLAPSVQTLAMFCPTKVSFTFGLQTVLGASGSLAMARETKPKYWIKTADAALLYSGLVMRMMGVKDAWRTLDEAMEIEKKSGKEAQDVEAFVRPNLCEVNNGGCFVLE
ncbi:hypothetical protein AB5N19_01361 [Seiridium cardinale]